jgi:hypothetical protein
VNEPSEPGVQDLRPLGSKWVASPRGSDASGVELGRAGNLGPHLRTGRPRAPRPDEPVIARAIFSPPRTDSSRPSVTMVSGLRSGALLA